MKFFSLASRAAWGALALAVWVMSIAAVVHASNPEAQARPTGQVLLHGSLAASTVYSYTFCPLVMRNYSDFDMVRPVVQLTSGQYAVSEGVGALPVIVTLSNPSNRTVTVGYATWDGTAQAGLDYEPVSGTLTFMPGQTTQTFSVTVVKDTLAEAAETFRAVLSNPVNATLGGLQVMTVTITDEASLTTVQYITATWQAYEGAGQATVVAALSAPSALTVTVSYATADGTATAGADYVSRTGVLTFTPGQTVVMFDVPILDDEHDEPDETVRLSLRDPFNAVLGTPAEATLTIADDDLVSPFSLQIAALHQVSGQGLQRWTAGAPAGPWLPEADWMALEETAFVTLTAALKESGASWSRVYISWAMIEPITPTAGQPPAYVWEPYYDIKLRKVAETGVHLIGTVTYAPVWAAQAPCAPIYPERLEAFGRFLTDLVTRYKQAPYNIRHWELINEPDGTWLNGGTGGLGCWGREGARYAQMLAVAYPAIKAADPEATVLMGGMAHDWFLEYAGPFYRYFPDEVMAAGGGNYIDALNFHYFPDFHAEWERWDPNSLDRRSGWLPAPTCGILHDGQGPAYEAWGIDLMAKATHVRNRMQTCFGVNKPVWVTELAEHGYAGDVASLAQQARYVIQGHARGLAAGVANITWYALTTPNDTYQQGLLYEDWSPKPSFYAYKTLTRELKDHVFARTLNVTDLEGYVFVNPLSGQEKTVAWGSGVLTLATAQARVVDRWGEATFVMDGSPRDADGTIDGKVALQLSADPVFVQMQ